MNINNINLRKLKTDILIETLSRNIFDTPTISERKQLRKEIISAIENAVYLIAVNSLLIAFKFDKESMFHTIKREGLFRYSKYVSKKCIIASLIQQLLDYDNTLLLFSAAEKKYLSSVLNLSSQHKFFCAVDQMIIEEIDFFEKKYKGKSMIKSLLAYTDFLFFSNYIRSTSNDTTSIFSRSKEEIASAASYLIYRICNKGEKYQRLQVIAEDYIKSENLQAIIVACCWISDFKEFEILIEHFDYGCLREENKLKIIPTSIDFEKSIRLGYIKSQIQIFNDLRHLHDLDIVKNSPSMEEFVDKLIESKKFKFIKLVKDNNYSRYKLEVPEPIFEYISGNFSKQDFLFKEEVIYLSQIFKEQLLNVDDLKEIKIKGDLSIMEVIKIKRSIDLLYLIYYKELYNLKKVEEYLIYRSLIPVFKEDDFYNLIKKLTSIENIDSYLDIMCWESKLDIFFDVQYRPIIFLDEHFVIPLSIFANSNSVRNLYASEYKQNNKTLFSDGHKDVLVDKLYTYFEKASIKIYKQIPVPKTDIDLFAVYGDTLFIFECKHTLHPVSVYDQRTTFDYIKKAEKQLDLIMKLYSEGKLIKLLEKICKINLTSIKRIVPAIVLSNRIFNGNIFKYPVRNINEIENILLRGTMSTNNGVFWIWEKDTLQLSDLLEYFSLEGKIVKFLFESLSGRTISYDNTYETIEYETYYLDLKEAEEKMKQFTSNMRVVKNDHPNN